MSIDAYHHGMLWDDVETGIRALRTASSSTIGVVVTAPNADPDKFPLNTPVLCLSDKEAASLVTDNSMVGTFPLVRAGIYAQCEPAVVYIRVEEGADEAETLANVIGSVDAVTGAYTGIYALLAAPTKVHVVPKLLGAPAFSHNKAVAEAIRIICSRLNAHAWIESSDSGRTDAVDYRSNFDDRRVRLIDPSAKMFIGGEDVVVPMSAIALGHRAKVDNDQGWWVPESNRVVSGVTSMTRDISFGYTDQTTEANYLNENHIDTMVWSNGYRFWGDRNLSTDQRWQFACVSRTNDVIHDSVVISHNWAVDQGITKAYYSAVIDGVMAKMREWQALGAIYGGEIVKNPELNTKESTSQGTTWFDVEFSPVFPNEKMVVRSTMSTRFLEV